jgi:hypothetical protein
MKGFGRLVNTSRPTCPLREAARRAEHTMMLEGFRVTLMSGKPPGGYWQVPRFDHEKMLREPSEPPDMRETQRSDRYEIRRYGIRSVVLLHKFDRVDLTHPCFVRATEVDRAAWVDVLQLDPVRIKDPGECRRVLRSDLRSPALHHWPGQRRLGPRKVSKRTPLSVLRRMAEDKVNAPKPYMRNGAFYDCAIDLGHYAISPEDRRVWAWGDAPNGWSIGFAALAFEAWNCG